MIEYELLPYAPCLDEPIARLFAADGFDRSPDYLAWIFNSPGRHGMVATARDTSEGGKIVGVLGLVPTPVQCDGKSFATHLAIDLVVDQAYRGRGIFMGLGRIALDWSAESGAPLFWGFPNQSAAHAWFNRFSWVNLGTVPLLARPLRTGFMLGRLVPGLAKIDLPLFRTRHIEVEGFREVKYFEQETDQLWHGFARRVGCCTVRNATALNWRIFERPGGGHRAVASFAQSGIMDALVCSKMVRRYGGNILFIMEAMSSNDEADERLLHLLNHEISYAAGRGADAALCWSPMSAPNRHVYRKAGFLPVPDRLRPSKSFFGIKPASSVDRAFNREWYISYLDLDVI